MYVEREEGRKSGRMTKQWRERTTMSVTWEDFSGNEERLILTPSFRSEMPPDFMAFLRRFSNSHLAVSHEVWRSSQNSPQKEWSPTRKTASTGGRHGKVGPGQKGSSGFTRANKILVACRRMTELLIAHSCGCGELPSKRQGHCGLIGLVWLPAWLLLGLFRDHRMDFWPGTTSPEGTPRYHRWAS